MALVLVGFNSYSVIYKTGSGIERRITVKKGQDVSALNLPEDTVEQLRNLKVRLSASKWINAFIETAEAPKSVGMHAVGGKISNHAMKNAQAVPAATAEVVAEAVVEAIEEPSVAVEAAEEAPEAPEELPVVVEPALKPAPAKKKSSPKKKKSAAKKSASKSSSKK